MALPRGQEVGSPRARPAALGALVPRRRSGVIPRRRLLDLLHRLLALVLADYHVLEGRTEINEAVDWLLEGLPDGCRVVIGSRRIPADLDLARLAHQFDAAGIGTKDLRLTAEEAAALLAARRDEV